MTPPTYTSFVEVICNLPPLVAQAAYDDIVRGRIAGPGWQLRLMNQTVETRALRRSSALLVAGWPWRVAVGVELDAWSQRRVTVGIRPRGRNAPPAWTSLYFATAHAVADHLSASMVAWAERPLRELPLSA